MDRLPVELLSLVATYLQRWNIAPQPFSHLTETSECGTVGWLTHTSLSRRDICSFRLVCQKCHSSSLRTFGELLGDRVFRWTKVGMKDIQALSDHAPLKPYIRTLTFGNAQFKNRDNYALQMGSLAYPDAQRKRLLRAYADYYQWQLDHDGNYYDKAISVVLANLPNLRNLRLLISDAPDVHLGGWLSAEDKESDALVRLNDFVSESDESIYDSGQGVIERLSSLIVALEETVLRIEDFRIGCGYAVHPLNLCNWMIPRSMLHVRHLRFDIDPENLGEDSPNATFEENVLSELSDLESLSLSLVHDAAFTQFAKATADLVMLLRNLSCLEKLTVRGEWSYTENDLFALVDDCESLKTLVLKGPILLEGSWTSVVERVLATRSSTLQHFQLSSMSFRQPNTKITPAFDGAPWQDFIGDVRPSIEEHGKCTVYLSSGDYGYVFRPSQR
ncbi:hypothetical protein CC86DRAFT_118126 [Ophiobolus disseminans]|uniref:Uncharacterized protein n=1 Tax=Ophiobolus disseminans TaxID=1469910 RepID=A0A6A6ZIW4_9PLEO|nr:hypothetical protein CC86DRAFT_118126 [Ophiobolus disseminans]